MNHNYSNYLRKEQREFKKALNFRKFIKYYRLFTLLNV